MTLLEVLVLAAIIANGMFMWFTIRRQNMHWEYMKSLDRQMRLMEAGVRKVITEAEERA